MDNPKLRCAIVQLKGVRPLLARCQILTIGDVCCQYGCVMVMMVSAQTAWGWWTGVRLAGWAHSAQAEDLRHAMRLREHLAPLLQDLAQWHPLPQKLNTIIKVHYTSLSLRSPRIILFIEFHICNKCNMRRCYIGGKPRDANCTYL